MSPPRATQRPRYLNENHSKYIPEPETQLQTKIHGLHPPPKKKWGPRTWHARAAYLSNTPALVLHWQKQNAAVDNLGWLENATTNAQRPDLFESPLTSAEPRGCYNCLSFPGHKTFNTRFTWEIQGSENPTSELRPIIRNNG